jgi:hypothetical protein
VRRRCGPLDVAVASRDDRLAALALQCLDLYGWHWPRTTRSARIDLVRATDSARATGRYLTCARMAVDRTDGHFLASTLSGTVAHGSIGADRDRWKIRVPPRLELKEPEKKDIEDVISLACTVAWRREGWIPLHAGAVVRDNICAILCAPSGGGKSTLAAALLRRGWQTLGDDKLLMRLDGERPVLAALLKTFNLHPKTSTWLDGLDNLTDLPRYSAWTEKRRVGIDAIVRGVARSDATPTHLIQIERDPASSTVVVAPMNQRDVLPALLKQIVIPRERDVVSQIISVAGGISKHLRGVVLRLGEDVYAHSEWWTPLEQALA